MVSNLSFTEMVLFIQFTFALFSTMYRILIFCIVSYLSFLSCRPTVKEEVQTVEPPAVTLRDTSITFLPDKALGN
jgi:hypothetical protein